MAQFVKNLPAMQETPVQFKWNTRFPRQIKVICTSQCGLLESKQVQANKSTVVVADPLLAPGAVIITLFLTETAV